MWADKRRCGRHLWPRFPRLLQPCPVGEHSPFLISIQVRTQCNRWQTRSTCHSWRRGGSTTSRSPPSASAYTLTPQCWETPSLTSSGWDCLGQAMTLMCRHVGWKSLVILYETEEGLVRLQEVLRLQNTFRADAIKVQLITVTTSKKLPPRLPRNSWRKETTIIDLC